MPKNQTLMIVLIFCLVIGGVYYKFSNEKNLLLEDQNTLIQKLIDAKNEQNVLRKRLVLSQSKSSKGVRAFAEKRDYTPHDQGADLDSYIEKSDRIKGKRIFIDKEMFFCQEDVSPGKQRAVVMLKKNGKAFSWVNFRNKMQVNSTPDLEMSYSFIVGHRQFYIDSLEDGLKRTLVARIMGFGDDGLPTKVFIPKLSLELSRANCNSLNLQN